MAVVVLTEEERRALERAAAGERRVRPWRRYQAVLRLAAGEAPGAVAAALGCGLASVYGWAVRWREQGLAGLGEPVYAGRTRRLAGAGETRLAELLASDPQARGWHATGWTVPLLQAELTAAGHAVSGRTLRRALHRAGWRWKRPKYVLGRPDPQYAEKKARSRSG